MTVEPIRVLIVDDSALYRMLIRDVLGKIPGCQVVGHADDGDSALREIEKSSPHLITLDVEMPTMSGIEVLREMNRRQIPTRAIMISRLTSDGTATTADALMEGAFEFICKPAAGDVAANKAMLRSELTEKLDAFRVSRRTIPETVTESPRTSEPARRYSALIIGSSTGGPEVLRGLLAALPADFPVPVIVVQHMPQHFTGALAARLDHLSALQVREGKQGMTIAAGDVVVAPGGQHLKLEKKGEVVRLRLTDDPPENSCRPAVDYTLRSACKAFDGNALALILTGMGKDGLKGCTALQESGGRIIAQHPHGCTVYGMPKAIIEAGIADRIVLMGRLAKVLCQEVR